MWDWNDNTRTASGSQAAAADDWGGTSANDGWGASAGDATAGTGVVENASVKTFDDGYADNGAGGGVHDTFTNGDHAAGDNGTDNYDDDANDKCFGCGEVGHRRAECPNPQEMTCRYCKEPGHMVKDCPTKPPMVCHNCGEDGHLAKTCENARKVNRDDVAIVSAEAAWAKIKQAAAERDIDDAKDGIQEYVKALNGQPSLREIQQGLMDDGIKLFLIAMERPLLGTFTNMDLQGNCGKKYSITYRFSDRPMRPKERENWPMNAEEILARLDDAGEVVDSGKRRCNNCGEVGHRAVDCPEEKVDKSDLQPKVTCYNCKEDGHRSRDCTQPRVNHAACHKCGEEGHKSRECPNSQDNTGTCYNCGEEGHVKSDCPQPRAQRPMTCYNCNEEGHRASECPSNN